MSRLMSTDSSGQMLTPRATRYHDIDSDSHRSCSLAKQGARDSDRLNGAHSVLSQRGLDRLHAVIVEHRTTLLDKRGQACGRRSIQTLDIVKHGRSPQATMHAVLHWPKHDRELFVCQIS
jgi:hypothetical protein